MKKITLLMLAFSFVLSGWAAQEASSPAEVTQLIAEGNYKKLKKAVINDNSQRRISKHLFFIASAICMPGSPEIVAYSMTDKYPTIEHPVCNKGANQKVINTLLDKYPHADEATLLYISDPQKDKNEVKHLRLITPLYYLKKSQPEMFPEILEKLDPCIVALEQMQDADPKDPYYYSYADYWRENNCQVHDPDYIELATIDPKKVGFDASNYSNRYEYDRKLDNARALQIGMSKLKLMESLGGIEPSYYEHPSPYREIITFRRVYEPFKDAGFYKADDTIYTLDRDVVTHISYRDYFDNLGLDTIYEHPEMVTALESEKRGY